MKTMMALIKRNTKLFFADKTLFFVSLITPVILLVLYVTFLGNVYTDSLQMAAGEIEISDGIMQGFAGAQLISSILAVSCVTVSFCSNMLMVQDKANGTLRDLAVSPVKSWVLSMSYFFATLISTLIVCLSATVLCLGYVALTGWYMSIADVLLLVLDVFILCLFGVALSSVVSFFLSSQGQISAVGTMVSSSYGFLCGAYMPLSQFSEGLRDILMFLPGTYGTSLVRNHAMRGLLEAMEEEGIPAEFVESVRDSFDCNLFFFDNKVGTGTMYAVICSTVVVLILLYVMMNILRFKKATQK